MPTAEGVVRGAAHGETLGVIACSPSVLKFLVHSQLRSVVNFV